MKVPLSLYVPVSCYDIHAGPTPAAARAILEGLGPTLPQIHIEFGCCRRAFTRSADGDHRVAGSVSQRGEGRFMRQESCDQLFVGRMAELRSRVSREQHEQRWNRHQAGDQYCR
jgi:hypothetical protein